MSADPPTSWLQRMEEALQQPLAEAGPAPVMQVIRDAIYAENLDNSIRTDMALAICSRLQELLQEPELRLSFLAVWLKGLGALLETGADSHVVAPAVVDSLVIVLDELCYHYVRFSRGVEGLSEEQNAYYLNDVSEGLGEVEPAAATILSGSRMARDAVRSHHHLPRYFRLLRWDFGFLHKIGFVFDEEPILFLFPEEKLGFEATISGISDNYQLQAILYIVMSQLFPDDFEPLPRAFEACYTGVGAPEVTGSFLPTWQPLLWTAYDGENLSLETHHFIWGAGIPADIMQCPALDGKRVVLLTDPPYQRSINVSRDFEGLRAGCYVTTGFSPEEVEDILAAIASVSEEKRMELLHAHSADTNHSIF